MILMQRIRLSSACFLYQLLKTVFARPVMSQFGSCCCMSSGSCSLPAVAAWGMGTAGGSGPLFGVAVPPVGCPRQGWGTRGCRHSTHGPCAAGSGWWVPWQLAVEVSSEPGLDGLGQGECGRLGTGKAGAAPRWTQEKSQGPSRGGLAPPSPVDAALAAELVQILRLASASPLLEPLREKGKPDRGPCSTGRPKSPPKTPTRGDRPPRCHSSNGNWQSLLEPTAPAPALPARGQLSPTAPAVFSRIGLVWGFSGFLKHNAQHPMPAGAQITEWGHPTCGSGCDPYCSIRVRASWPLLS